ncbi:cytochrome c peroxidase [Limnohabitans sp.]|uniref:cytochrome-c peroxidase n=1 Tax=Limnohabitans sp. TaxID=1907725 RepID=UPI00286F0063|nr:cytochrome c peroxidase [Limnohabitans sp.]
MADRKLEHVTAPNTPWNQSLRKRKLSLLHGAWMLLTIGLAACGGGGGAGSTASQPETNPTPTTTSTTPGVATYLSLNLNALPNYVSPDLPVHYDTALLATRNVTTNITTDKGATLGRVLFNDVRLSFNNTKSCASCHQQINGFVDQNQFSTGFAGGLTTAHAMRLGNVAFYQGNSMFWNKRATSLEDQATDPIQNAIEMGFDTTHGGLTALISKMQALPYYPELFAWATGDSTITETKIQNALAQFQRSMISADSKWDRAYAVVYAANGNVNSAQNFGRSLAGANIPAANRFSASEDNGRDLFMRGPNNGGKGCAGCHQPPTFALDPNSKSNGLDLNETVIFKSPSLKNVALSGHFMHDGRFGTLEQVLNHYASGVKAGTARDNRLPVGGIAMTAQEQADIVAFLQTLTDTTLNTHNRFANPFIK